MNRLQIFGMGWLIAVLGSCSTPGSASVTGATVALIDTSGTKIGEAIFSERNDKPGVVIRLRAWSLPPGVHGFHIHDSGSCETPEFTTAGGHFNPFGKKHGLKNPEGPHAGDLPNLVVRSNGTAEVTLEARLVTLKPGINSLLTPKGTSLVVHADPDDEMSDPAGKSGARIACGIIRGPAPSTIEAR